MLTSWKLGLWTKTLESAPADFYASSKEMLRVSLETMRSNVNQLIAMIPADCKDLTVHDISHLDALWEMATLIAGEDYDLNPAEAFVFGAAVLLHDAGLTTAAFPGGLNEVRRSEEWADICAGALRQHGLEPNEQLLNAPPSELLGFIKFATLRALHAKQAEKMARIEWTKPSGEHIFLIENSELRQAFGSSIGRIAHSHHWDLDRVAHSLNANLGTCPNLPSEWSINEVKVACLLRCADAAHFDSRRAPGILFAATRPSGTSELHWLAQNKINKPVIEGNTIIYSSGEDFKASEAEAWWLVYDFVKILDKQLRGSNSLFEEKAFPQFQAARVYGAESPSTLSRKVGTESWRPVDAEVRVTDPVHLAKTLGGKSLYGDDSLACIRELLQNAADAVRPRRQLEEREASWGKIRVVVEPNHDDLESCLIHIDDNGTGMSERVLCGHLIDFGKSLWSSSLLTEEFPGLQSKNLRPIGKFGIGFFSVFQIAQHVTVITKRFEDGIRDINVLEFRSLASRPLLRAARSRELPTDFSTRVTLRVDQKMAVLEPRASALKNFRGNHLDDAVYFPHYQDHLRREIPASFRAYLARLVCMLDIDFEYENRINGDAFSHSWDVYNTSPVTFLSELFPSLEKDHRVIVAHSATIRPLIDDRKTKLGRASLSTLDELNVWRYGFVSVGGFTYLAGRSINVPYVGVIEGRTDEAMRRNAFAEVPDKVVVDWLSQQAKLLERSRFLRSQLIQICHLVVSNQADSGDLPFCRTGDKLITLSETRSLLENLEQIVIPLRTTYTSLQILGYSNLEPHHYELSMRKDLFIIAHKEMPFVDDEIVKRIKESPGKGYVLEWKENMLRAGNVFFEVLKEVWQSEPRLEVMPMQIFDTDIYATPSLEWVIVAHRVH